MISFLTTSIIGGLSLLCASLVGLASSSSRIQCMHMEELIPFKSAMVHPMPSCDLLVPLLTYLLGRKIRSLQ